MGTYLVLVGGVTLDWWLRYCCSPWALSTRLLAYSNTKFNFFSNRQFLPHKHHIFHLKGHFHWVKGKLVTWWTYWVWFDIRRTFAFTQQLNFIWKSMTVRLLCVKTFYI